MPFSALECTFFAERIVRFALFFIVNTKEDAL